MESRIAHCPAFSACQQSCIRHACCGHVAGHPAKIVRIGRYCCLHCPPLPESITRTAACCRTGLSDIRYIGRMADLRRYLDCISRFQNRASGNGCSGNWWLSLYQILEILTESSKQKLRTHALIGLCTEFFMFFQTGKS